MVCLLCDFNILLTVFNQSYNCQRSHYLGRNGPPNARLSVLSWVLGFNHALYLSSKLNFLAKKNLADPLVDKASKLRQAWVPSSCTDKSITFTTSWINFCRSTQFAMFTFIFTIAGVVSYKYSKALELWSEKLKNAERHYSVSLFWDGFTFWWILRTVQKSWKSVKTLGKSLTNHLLTSF